MTCLVDHHDCEQVANSGEEEAIDVVLYLVADGVAEDVEDDLTNDEEEDAKRDITEWPAVFEGSNNQNDLADSVDEEANGVDDVSNDKDSDRVSGVQSGPALEGQEVHSTADDEHDEGGETQ